MRLALGLSYDGHGFHGWQSQVGVRTVQDVLEAALAEFAQQRVSTLCTGRTDAGVHGLMQVVHFDTPLEREAFSWMRGVNRYLPRDVSVQWVQQVPDAFHCRASATSRRYAYIVLESASRPALEAHRVGWSLYPLNAQRMQESADLLLGTHDFSSFRAAQCQAQSPVKTLLRADVQRHGNYWRFDFEASAFLHHMIRNIMGCLIAVGQGKQPAAWVREVLAARDRDAAAPTFPPDGLYFLGPRYAAQWGLPERTAAFDWLPGSLSTTATA